MTAQIQEEMEKRYAHLVGRLTNLKTESEETWKTIETAEKTLLEMINARDYDIAHWFSEEPRIEPKEPESVVLKRKADRQETEEFYLSVRVLYSSFDLHFIPLSASFRRNFASIH